MIFRATRIPCLRVTIALLLAFALAGCHTWVEIPEPFAPWIVESDCESVRLVANGIEIEMTEPEVSGEILTGQVASRSMRISVPISSISRVQARHVDRLRTSGAVSVGAVTAAVILGLVAGGSDEGDALD
ncbi:MAG: hypothetical protein M8840_09005 [marine benthic group bacterium]|jgi:hypothetical protein|nr:hypothetical protein [Gemmatimonadota bacterium]